MFVFGDIPEISSVTALFMNTIPVTKCNRRRWLNPSVWRSENLFTISSRDVPFEDSEHETATGIHGIILGNDTPSPT